MEKRMLNGIDYQVDERLNDFAVFQKPSSNVEFFGGCEKEGKVFVQFRNGSTYVYENVSADVIDVMNDAPSIGQFVSATFSKNYSFKHYPERMVRRFPVTQK